MNTNTDIQYIWSDLHHELKKFITLKVSDTSLAEDILQDVFVKIHLNIHQLKDPAKLTSWVYQITRNTIADYGKERRFSDASLRAELSEEEEQENVYSSLSDCINSKIAKLPPHERDAVLLTYFQNYSQKALADFLGLSYSGAKNRIQRTREKLGQSILDCDHVDSDGQGKILDYHGKKS